MLTLNNGIQIPPIGLGTYKLSGAEGECALRCAISTGYRLFDTAFVYENESLLGEVIRTTESVKREDLFVVSKLGPQFHRPELVERGCRASLERLGLDYVDLFLMHSPVGVKFDEGDSRDSAKEGAAIDDEVSPLDTWKALESCYHKGLGRSIGLSNFNEAQLMEIVQNAAVKPTVHQVECSVGFRQDRMVELCKKEGIVVMAYRPLGKPKPAEKKPDYLYSGAVVEVAKDCNKTPAQVALRYLIEEGHIPIPKSSNPERLKENLDSLKFELGKDVTDGLKRSVEQHERTATMEWLKDAKHYPF